MKINTKKQSTQNPVVRGTEAAKKKDMKNINRQTTDSQVDRQQCCRQKCKHIDS